MKQYTLAKGMEGLKAISSAGVFVRVDVSTFLIVVAKVENPLVVVSHEKSFFSGNYKYLTSFKGFVFCTESEEPITLPKEVEMFEAKKIWLPEN